MPAQAKTYVQPRIAMQRPPLPIEHANPHIKTLDPSKPPPVKFQEILREGQATIVGRIKIPTPNGHAFILRRLDTGAISLTTMFRAAFPTATDEAERAETVWVKTSYDTSGANKSGKARFAGTWVNCDVALSLADGYSLGPVITSLVASAPDPNYVYRRSTRGQQAIPSDPNSPSSITTSPKELGPNPSKRRREASPTSASLQSPVQQDLLQPVAAQVPSTPANKLGTTPTPRSSAKRSTTPTTSPQAQAPPSSPGPRRSLRIKSPARNPSGVSPATSPKKTPKVLRAIREEMITPGSDETAVDEDATEATKLTEINMADDVQEQQELIQRLKAERDLKAQQERVREGVEDHPMEAAETEGVSASKRAREEGPEYSLNIREPETEERQIVSNSRVRGRMGPQRKSLAWGAFLFAAGLSAVTFIPTLPNFF